MESEAGNDLASIASADKITDAAALGFTPDAGVPSVAADGDLESETGNDLASILTAPPNGSAAVLFASCVETMSATSDTSSVASPGASLLAGGCRDMPSNTAFPHSGGKGEPQMLASLGSLGRCLASTEPDKERQHHQPSGGCNQGNSARVRQQRGEAGGKSVIHFPVLSFSPRLGPRTPEHTRAVEAVAKAQATRFALEQARKRPPVADQFYVARAVLRARDARFVLPSEASEEQSARVDVLERKARQLLERLNKNGVLKATTQAEEYLEKLEIEAFQAIRVCQSTQRLTASPAATSADADLPKPPPVPELTPDCSTESDLLPLNTVRCASEWQRANIVLAELLSPSFRPFQGRELLEWVLDDLLRPARQRARAVTQSARNAAASIKHGSARETKEAIARAASKTPSEMIGSTDLEHALPTELTDLLTLPSLLPPSVMLPAPAKAMRRMLKPYPMTGKSMAHSSDDYHAELTRRTSGAAVRALHAGETAEAQGDAATERHAAETAEAQRWADVEKVNAVLECRAFAVSAAQPRHLRYKDANGSYLDMSNVDLTQDMSVILAQMSAAGIELVTSLVSELRALHVPFDVQAHHTRVDASRSHIGVPTEDEFCIMRIDELIVAERTSRVRVRGRRAPTGRPNIGSKAARQAAARRRATQQ